MPEPSGAAVAAAVVSEAAAPGGGQASVRSAGAGAAERARQLDAPRLEAGLDGQAAAAQLGDRRVEQRLEPPEIEVVVVAQAPAGARQVEQLGGALALLGRVGSR